MRINDREREMWIDNFEPLYWDWKFSGMSKREYIKTYREVITSVIEKELNKEPSR